MMNNIINEVAVIRAIERHERECGEKPRFLFYPMPDIEICGVRVMFTHKKHISTIAFNTQMDHDLVDLHLVKNEEDKARADLDSKDKKREINDL